MHVTVQANDTTRKLKPLCAFQPRPKQVMDAEAARAEAHQKTTKFSATACFTCKKPAEMRCGKCKLTFFCSKECQRSGE
jgi:hypothetical protein